MKEWMDVYFICSLISFLTPYQANPLSKYFQKGDDPNLDQLLASLKEVARFCLRSLLTAIFEWRKRLIKQIQGTTQWTIVTSGYEWMNGCNNG